MQSFIAGQKFLPSMLKNGIMIPKLQNTHSMCSKEANIAAKHVEECLKKQEESKHAKQATDASNCLDASPLALAGQRLGTSEAFQSPQKLQRF